MKVNVEVDEQELKERILEGISLEDALDEAVEECQKSLRNKLEVTIRSTQEYKDACASSDENKMKEAIQSMVESNIINKLQAEIKCYVTLESQLPRIVKSYVNDFLKEYVEEELEKQIRKVYKIEIKVNKNGKKNKVKETI
jgi:hypothetical protein